MQPETIMIDDVKYVKQDSLTEKEVVTFTGDETIASRMIGKKVIVRSYNEGINIGIVVLADETGVELKDCRRIHYMVPKDKALSWYEGVAVSGLSSSSRVSGTVKTKVIVEKYSMTIVSDKAFKQIMGAAPNGQS